MNLYNHFSCEECSTQWYTHNGNRQNGSVHHINVIVADIVFSQTIAERTVHGDTMSWLGIIVTSWKSQNDFYFSTDNVSIPTLVKLTLRTTV